MKQYEAVINVMEENGGFATLGFLNQNVLKVPNVEWNSKTPFASIRRIVQDSRFFFKIRPGLWALNTFKDKLPFEFIPEKSSSKKKEEFNHSYYQGLLVEIGNMKKFQTFIPYQDKNKMFLNKKLGDISTIKEFYPFSYDQFTQKAKTIDVSWFNDRKMPISFFEVEHTTDIQNSLIKFVELQYFYVDFVVVADVVRKEEYDKKMSLETFRPIKGRVGFLNYNELSDMHTATSKDTKLNTVFALSHK